MLRSFLWIYLAKLYIPSFVLSTPPHISSYLLIERKQPVLASVLVIH